MVLNTSELLPEPETPVNTVSRRFGSSTLMSLRLFTRAPCTRIRSWRSATCAGDCVSVLVAVLIVSPSVTRGRLRGLRGRRLARSNQLRAVRLVLLRFGPWSLWAPALRSTARHQPGVLAGGLEADVVGPIGLRRYAEQGGVHRLGRRQVGHGMQHGLDSLGGRAGHGHS